MINTQQIVEKMKNQKINYDTTLKKTVMRWEKEKVRPKMLVHIRCAPCSMRTLESISQYADITLFFSDSNIHPRSEHLRRLHKQKRLVDQFDEKTDHHVALIVDEHRPSEFTEMVLTNHLEDEREGGACCSACSSMRLDLVAQKTQEPGYDYFGSALTISPKRNAVSINQIGMDIQKIYRTQYLPSDFKKNKGYGRSLQTYKGYGIYRQYYYDCVFAAKQQGCDLKEINREAGAYLKMSTVASGEN